MKKLREIIRLSVQLKLSRRKISGALKTSRRTISTYLERFKQLDLNYEDFQNLSDIQMEQLFKQNQPLAVSSEKRYVQLEEQFKAMEEKLKKPGITLSFLHEKYRRERPDGYGYSQFCHHFQQYKDSKQVSMVMNHDAGDKMFVDYAGKKLCITDRETKKKIPVETFVATLGASLFTYVEATYSQKKDHWISSNENAIRYFGGSPRAIVPDCLKSGVTKANRYEPDINPEYSDFAGHYNTCILPARPARPKDKALVENAVKNVYFRIYAELSDRDFYSIQELNRAIAVELEKLNERPFQRRGISRRQLFEELEKKELRPLPKERYNRKKYLKRKVQYNYHIELAEDRHYYSVPWRLKGETVQVIYSDTAVEIYHKNKRAALHQRVKTGSRYTTVKEHMPPHHRFYRDWSPERFLKWASDMGTHAEKVIAWVLGSCRHPEQGFKSSMGILNLARKYGKARLNEACGYALNYDFYSYKKIQNILEKGLDLIQEESLFDYELPQHENVRGCHYYANY